MHCIQIATFPSIRSAAKVFIFAKISFRQKPVPKPVPKLVLKERSFETKDEKSLASVGKGPRWELFTFTENFMEGF